MGMQSKDYQKVTMHKKGTYFPVGAAEGIII